MNFSRFLDIQSWWEVPSIAYFCSLFRTAFNLLDFDIEELEEALLTDGTEESASSLLTELIVRLLNGCLGNNDISAFNYQMYLRRLFRRKCQETARYNPFNTDIDFQFLPLRTKVEILYALCDFRLDAEDVFDLFKNLEAESLRVEPLGWDDNDSAYWYFYGTRLYREDIIRKPKSKSKKKKSKDSKKRGWFYGDDWLDDDETERVWQVVCFTEEDWSHLTEKFRKASSKVEKELFRSLSQNFLPEIPRLFQEKERLQRERLLAPRRTSSRVLQKIKQKEEENKVSVSTNKAPEDTRETQEAARDKRAKRRNLLRSKSDTSISSESEKEEMPQKSLKRSKSEDKKSKNSSATDKGEPPPEPKLKTGRKTNNSLASATGQIVIPDNDEPVNSTRKKLKTSQIFSQTEEDVKTDMYKVLEQLTAHEDAWPFMDPVEEEYAPNYYAVIRRPMDLHKMEERLDNGYYTDFTMFKADFKLIVNNCRLYNGQDNEYTMMVDNLQAAFDRLTEKYIHRLSSSDEEIAVEYQLPTPSRKHKLKDSESPNRHKKKKRKHHSESVDRKMSTSNQDIKEEAQIEKSADKVSKEKESHRNKHIKSKKKHKGHHRHGKHSKNHKKYLQNSEYKVNVKSKHSKKQKHNKEKDRDGKKSKQKKKKKHGHDKEKVKQDQTQETPESSNRSRSASPLPSIHTLTPSPIELDNVDKNDKLTDPDFYKDKYDKIKERRRNAAKDSSWESLFDYKQKSVEKHKQNLNLPEKDKNQKLKETIEKLKAKNEKYKDSSLFNDLFHSNQNVSHKNKEPNKAKGLHSEKCPETELTDDDNNDALKVKSSNKKGIKKNTAKNESASEALEQAVKDISKWLDDAPKSSALSSPCVSPAQTISTEEHDNSRLDDEFSQSEKFIGKKDMSRKRPSSREPKIVKRREIQRTIDRLQPGKSKGNLLTNIVPKNVEKVEEVIPLGPLAKAREGIKTDESSPKLSLGSVLPAVEFALGDDHKFSKSEEPKPTSPLHDINAEVVKNNDKVVTPTVKKCEDTAVQCNKKDAEVETEPVLLTKPSQEKATPNLSAWFKAFGAPKSTPSTPSAKKKIDEVENEEKPSETNTNDNKAVSPKNVTKYDSPADPGTPNPEGGDSPLPNSNATSRQRRTSTGSSVSERSSFSQDLDSPRHQMSHTSPLLRSPASPRMDDFQKITYPIINGTVRAGFYQDTTSIKSSPEKSCSPREAPQSPYSPYSQHVYVSNNSMGSSTPNYFVDHNKSPLPTYGHNPPPYYDTSKTSSNNKPVRTQEDFTALGSECYQQNQYAVPYSPSHSPYQQGLPANYARMHNSPQPIATSPTPVSTQSAPDAKSSLFPVKKRTYNEPENVSKVLKRTSLPSENDINTQNKNDFQRLAHTLSVTTTNKEIETVQSEKSAITNLSNAKDKTNLDNVNYQSIESNISKFDKKPHQDVKLETSTNTKTPVGMIKKDNVDMVNMGYMNPEDRRNSGDTPNALVTDLPTSKDILKTNLLQQPKGYEVEKIAMNLGLNNQQNLSSKTGSKSCMTNNIPPAHSHEKLHSEINLNHNITQAHHNQYEPISGVSSVSNFSLNDIELANKKLYGCNSSTASNVREYESWKTPNQMRKLDQPSDYSNPYSSNSQEKIKTDVNSTSSSISALNTYNKALQQQQYLNYAVSRSSAQRAQDLQQNLQAELRIPNPRGLIKPDHLNSAVPSVNEVDMISKNIDSQKSEKLVQNHPLVGSMPYKTSYSSHSTIPVDSLRNLSNIPQMLERYTSEDRYLSTFSAATGSSLYHDKTFQMAQMFNKSMPSEIQAPTTNVSIYSQPSVSVAKETNIYKANTTTSTLQDAKSKPKRKRTDSKQPQVNSTQSYHTPACNTDMLSSVKTNMVPGSAFNFGSTTNMALGGGLYGDSSGFTIEDFRNSTNQLMAANYMAAAVAHQQRNSVAESAEKLVKPAHQNSGHNSGAFPFLGHSQMRGGYGFVGGESSPLYQQYLQRHQEELLRQTGAQIMGLYSPGYPPALPVRQPYDSLNRHSWL